MDVSLSDPAALRSVVGAALYLTVVGITGLALGALLRNTAAAISTVVVVFFVIAPLTLPTRTVCAFCGVGCDLDLRVQDNKIVRVDSPKDHDVTHGNFWIKGRFGYSHVHPGPSRRLAAGL